MEAQASLRAMEEGNLTAVLANLLDMMVSEQENSVDFTISSLAQILASFQWPQKITKKCALTDKNGSLDFKIFFNKTLDTWETCFA